MRIAYLTAGAAGMYCGSCLHDNALARTLQRRGVDCVLLPVYTPIRTDEENVSSDRLFFGGINIFLQQKMPWIRFLPASMVRWLDSPWLLKWATKRAGSTDPSTLGDLTVSMLRGREGRQSEAVDTMLRWLADELKPDCFIFSNLLIGGCIPAIREEAALKNAQIIVTLQGDDIFLDYLTEPHRSQAIELMSQIARSVDHFIVNSRFYAEKMGQILRIPAEKFHVLPLAIDIEPFASLPAATAPPESDASSGRPLRIGYFARMAPEKGLHHLVDAFIEICNRKGGDAFELHVAGWQGPQHKRYVDDLTARLHKAGLGKRHRFHGSPDLQGKLAFLRSLDLLSVPTVYQEPKGLFVLEAWAAGVPVLQPHHGAFPELIGDGGGRLFPAGDAKAFADALYELATDHDARRLLGEAGQRCVRERHTLDAHADALLHMISQPTA